MPAPRPLYLYKFHSKDCEVHSSNLPASAKKDYRTCDCAIWMTGMTAKGEFVPRTTTGQRDWSAAEAYIAKFRLEVANEILQGNKGISIENAAKNFLDAHAEIVGARALGQHELVLGRLQTYAAGIQAESLSAIPA